MKKKTKQMNTCWKHVCHVVTGLRLAADLILEKKVLCPESPTMAEMRVQTARLRD